MHRTLSQFAQALRSADLEISPAEMLDAFAVVQQVGLADRRLLHDALSMALAKSPTAKTTFATVYAHFFSQQGFAAPLPSKLRDQIKPDSITVLTTGLSHTSTQLVQRILANEQLALGLQLEQLNAASGLALNTLRDAGALRRYLTQAIGVDELRQANLHTSAATNTARGYIAHYAQDQIQAYVDSQYSLQVDASGKRALTNKALEGHLSQIPPAYYHDVAAAARRAALQLTKARRKRAKQSQRGTLDVKRLLRRNLAYDGAWVHIPWRKQQRKRPQVFVICDVSGSVRSVARFLLTFLAALSDVLPGLRAFAFSNELGEITHAMNSHTPAHAVEQTLDQWGRGNTDYGQALHQLRRLLGQDLDRHSTLIFLGDARNNYYPAHTQVLKELCQRANASYWLNPEEPSQWGEGDSLMLPYSALCTARMTCNRLSHIERFATTIVQRANRR